MNDKTERPSVTVLKEAIELQIKKSNDYQNKKSSVRQAMYYPRGLESINDIINAKMLRIRSLMEKYENDPGASGPNFESIEDSYIDMINYCSFAVAWCRGQIDGQDANTDILNRIKENNE